MGKLCAVGAHLLRNLSVCKADYWTFVFSSPSETIAIPAVQV